VGAGADGETCGEPGAAASRGETGFDEQAITNTIEAR
jgi:hypothetical protein